MRLKFIRISTPLAGAMSACVELRSHYSQRFIARLAECRNGMRITSTEVMIPSPRLPVLVMRLKHRSLQTLPGTCIVHLLTTVPVLALAVSQAGFHPHLAIEVPQRPSRHSFTTISCVCCSLICVRVASGSSSARFHFRHLLPLLLLS